MSEKVKVTPPRSKEESIRLARKLFIQVSDDYPGSILHQALAVALALYETPNIRPFGLVEALRESSVDVEIIQQATERTHKKARAAIEAKRGKKLTADEGPPAKVSPGLVKTTVTHVFVAAGHYVHMRKGILSKALDTPRGTMAEQGERKKRLTDMAVNFPVRYRRPRSLLRKI